MMNHRRRMLMHMAQALPPKDTLENTSWADIDKVAKAGKAAEYWAVHDTKTITFPSAVLGSTVITVKIMGFDYDDLASGGKAPITFGMVDCFATKQRMNATGQNVGGYNGCELYGTLINTVLPAFQAAIGSDTIKAVSKYTSAGNKSTTINTTTEKIWLYSEYEVFGVTTYSAAGEKPADKSVCYPAFTDAPSRIKKVGTLAAHWWERSPSVNYITYFCDVYNDGKIANAISADVPLGVSVGFCV